ncbi:MAG TPA: helix-hairpin-helix domain-containing protein [Bacillota bacterium]|nr:helix-hairpin-helix domain-containing protein [Bacillota bacterium]
MNFRRIFEQDKKLTVKVVAGVLLLVVAFAFYLAKERASEEDLGASKISGSGGAILAEGESDPGKNLPATGGAIEKEAVIMVDVAGAVASPRVVELPGGSRVFEAIEKAGGLTKDADTASINQAEFLTDGQKLYIPTGQEVKAGLNGSGQSISANAGSPAQLNQPKLININTADSAALQQLNGVGPATAEKIIDYRNANGKFKTVEDIKNVSGIGAKTFEKFKDKITV